MSAVPRVAGNVGALVRELVQAIRQSRSQRPRPPREGLVLEVGGGQRPNPRSDVVVDLYVADSFERAGEASLSLARPVVVADGHALPFADGSFSYTIALHVLEHATDPARFADELSRVAGAGFVEVPSREAELTFGWAYHPWLIDRAGGSLRFEPKGDRRAPAGEFFHRSFDESPSLKLWHAATRSRWLHSIEWAGSIPVQVTGESHAERTASFDVDRTVAALRRAGAEHGLKPLGQPVRRALRCPACGSQLRDAPGELECEGCERKHPIVGGVPVLIA